MNGVAEEIAQYQTIKYQLEVGDADITGFIDFHLQNEDESVIFELKATSDTSFDHVL